MFEPMLMCFGMFSRLHIGNFEWDERQGANAAVFLPLVGLVCGFATFITVKACRWLQLPADISGVLLLLSLFLVCGFLHFDGLMDSIDCLLSSRDREGKLRILKDPNIGAFAVVAVVLMFISNFASLKTIYSLGSEFDFVLLLTPAFARSWGACLMFSIKPLETSSLMRFFVAAATEYHRLAMFMASVLIIVVTAILSDWLMASCFVVVAIAAYWFVKHAEKELGGINGDISGASIVLQEAMLYLVIPMAFSAFAH